jgi:hypothetical protein
MTDEFKSLIVTPTGIFTSISAILAALEILEGVVGIILTLVIWLPFLSRGMPLRQ